MLHNDFLELGQNGNLIPTEKFKLCNRIDNWCNLPVPRHSLKLTIQSLSTFYFQIKSKANQKPGELDTATMANILLKVATILGREFQTDALKYISPLNRIGQHDQRVDDAVRLLELHDFIEIVNQTESRSQVCRFN